MAYEIIRESHQTSQENRRRAEAKINDENRDYNQECHRLNDL